MYLPRSHTGNIFPSWTVVVRRHHVYVREFHRPSCNSVGEKDKFFMSGINTEEYRARIFKLIRSSRIDSKEPIPPGCVAWRAGTTTLFLLGSVPNLP